MRQFWQEALAVAAEWQPDFILLDVMMPVMDGPATLVQLRENVKIKNSPDLYDSPRPGSTSRLLFAARSADLKPFDLMTLAASVRSVQPAENPMDDLRAGFKRVKRTPVISEDRVVLRDGNRLASALDRIKRTAHGLSGAGGIYGYSVISEAAADLEDAVIAELADPGRGEKTDRALDGLIFCASFCDTESGTARPLQEA